MADERKPSPTDKSRAFNKMCLIAMFLILAVVLGLYLFFAGTRQPHGATSGAGTQKGMIESPSRRAPASPS